MAHLVLFIPIISPYILDHKLEASFLQLLIHNGFLGLLDLILFHFYLIFITIIIINSL